MPIGDRKDDVCLQLHGQVFRQPKRCGSAMLDPKGGAFCRVSGSLYNDIKFEFDESEQKQYNSKVAEVLYNVPTNVLF